MLFVPSYIVLLCSALSLVVSVVSVYACVVLNTISMCLDNWSLGRVVSVVVNHSHVRRWRVRCPFCARFLSRFYDPIIVRLSDLLLVGPFCVRFYDKCVAYLFGTDMSGFVTFNVGYTL